MNSEPARVFAFFPPHRQAKQRSRAAYDLPCRLLSQVSLYSTTTRDFYQLSALRLAGQRQPETWRAVSTTRSSLRFCSPILMRFPTMSEAKPHCGLMAS